MPPDDIRKNAEVVIALKEIADFWLSLKWTENRLHGEYIAEQAKPLIMVIDFYHRSQPYFEGKADTLYFSKEYGYSDEGNYIATTPILQKIKSLLGEK